MSLEKFPQKPEKERSAAEIVKDYIKNLEKIEEYEIIREEIENTLREEKKKSPEEFQSERIRQLEDNLVGINRSISWSRRALHEMESLHPLLTNLGSNLYKYVEHAKLVEKREKQRGKVLEIRNRITSVIDGAYEELKSGEQLTPEEIESRKREARKELEELLNALESETRKKNDVFQELRKLEKELDPFMRWLDRNPDIKFVIEQKMYEWINAGGITEAVKKKMRKEEEETK
jgi:hypothetical protein